MKRFLSLFVVVVIALVTLTGCSTSKSYTWDVATGDTIKIKLDTTGGYNMTSDVPFTISKDDVTLTQGTFITIDGYNQYMDAINNDTTARVIDSGSKNNVTYTFYTVNNSEFNYLIKINDSNTGVLLGNGNSQKDAEDVFNRLFFSKE